MAPVDLASTLEEARLEEVAESAAGHNYVWPIWRYGRVLSPVGAESLAVDDAQQIGGLFEQGQPAAVRYLGERTTELKKIASGAGGTYLRDWPEHLRYGSAPFRELERTWHPEEIFLTYAFVPIVRLPRFVVEIGGGAWQVRESLTICGSPAKSKAWLTASLIAYHGEPADSVPLDRNNLVAARNTFEPFARAALTSLVGYYLKVLKEDTRSLPLEAPLQIRELAPMAETEIVSLASGVDLGRAFDALESNGLTRFKLEASRGLFPGAREVLDFLEWTESPEGPGRGEWQPGRPKILAIYAEEPACGTVRALVIPRIGAESNRTWYAALAERRQPEKPPSCYPLSEATGRFLAKEYGRYF
ncbi:MAG TPA: hypothetical protein VN493_13045 [Thermoanaerobaculia bacterium]|nr:hypothetical protein [Thermoanaerobaculia bacterium]